MASLIAIASTLLGLASVINGVLMIFQPEYWYWLVPGLSDRGPFNQHFVRDIGINYLLIGIAFIIGVLYARQRLLLWCLPTAWLTGHAIFHVWEVMVGICQPQALITDFAGVTLPALVGLCLIYASYRKNA